MKKGRVLKMPRRGSPQGANYPLTSYENRLSIGQHAMLRDLISGKLHDTPTGMLHMGTYGSLIKRGFAHISDKLDENGDPLPKATLLGIKAFENYETRPAPLRSDIGEVTDFVIQMLTNNQPHRRKQHKAS